MKAECLPRIKVTSHEICISYKDKNGSFMVNKHGRQQHLNQVVKANLLNNETHWHCVPTDRTPREGTASFLWYSCPKSFSAVIKSIKHRLRDVLQSNWPRLHWSVKGSKEQEILGRCPGLKGTKEAWWLIQYGSLDPGPEKDISGKTGKIQILY